jgi:hypothetical protein
VQSEFDLERLAELQELLGKKLAEIVRTLVGELTMALAAAGAGLDAGDLVAVALAAHAARNSALMIDAQPLLAALSELEARARAEDLVNARLAHHRLLELWPRLRRQLELAVDGDR